MRFGTILDDIVAAISPRRGLQRHQARKLLSKIRSNQYAAAKTTRVSGDWSPVDAGVNDIIAASSSAVRARVRQLVRDFPYFARAVNVVTAYTVGPGIMFQSRVTDPSGKLDKKNIQKIEGFGSPKNRNPTMAAGCIATPMSIRPSARRGTMMFSIASGQPVKPWFCAGANGPGRKSAMIIK